MPYVHALAKCMSFALKVKVEEGLPSREVLASLKTFRQMVPDDLVLGLVCDFLENQDEFGKVDYKGPHAKSFATFFAASPAMQNMREETAAWLEYAYCSGKEPCVNIADIGCGDGQAIGQVVEHLAPRGLTDAKIFLADISDGMVSKARAYLADLGNRLEVNLTLIPYVGPAQEVGMTRELASIFGDRIDAIVAATSIHHFPAPEKANLLKRLATLRPRLFVIADANAEHDLYPAMSPEIIAYAMRHYNGLYESLAKAGASQDVLNAARHFLGSEARDIIVGTKERIDYHTTAESWKKLLAEAGFTTVDPQEVASSLAQTARAKFRRLNLGHIDTFVYQEEVLIFTLGATMR